MDMQLLLVTDSDILFESLSKEIKRFGPSDLLMIHSDNISNALTVIKKNKIDICITDCTIKGVDVRHLIIYAKQIKKNIRIFVLSKSMSSDIQNAMYQSGADYFFNRILDTKDFLRQLREELNNSVVIL